MPTLMKDVQFPVYEGENESAVLRNTEREENTCVLWTMDSP
jgi:hypothetical protein